MTEYPALAWSKQINTALILARRMDVLAEAIKTYPSIKAEYDSLTWMYEEDPADLSYRLHGIALALEIIGETPNAYLDAEGMAAFHSEIERAALIEKEAEAIFDKIDPL